MVYAIHHNQAEDIIEVTFKGIIDIQTAKAALQDILGEVIRVQCFRVLTDLREANMALSVVEIFNLPKQLEEMSDQVNINARVIRRAIVTNQPKQMKFYEDIFSNRGYTAAVFDDPIKAKEWLCK